MIAAGAGADRPGDYCAGHPRFLDADLARIAQADGVAAAWRAAFDRFGRNAPAKAAGDFAVAVGDGGRLLLAVDRFAICNLYYRIDRDHLRFAARADALADAAPPVAQALYDYLYFHVVPAPHTVYAGVLRVPPGHAVLWERGEATLLRWWSPVFEEHHSESLSALGDEFRSLVRTAVAERAARGRVGCFLSGGTDSSTIAGMLRQVTGEAPATFSIGFGAAGYDEMEYARIAARHFGTDHHEHYVTPDDVADAVPRLAATFDQPFGNSSVVPAYYCARMARDAGLATLLAGDGGDELFGGNTRYAKQRVFDAYATLPRALRERCLESAWLPRIASGGVPGLRKVASYIEQARVPMPDRLEQYNLLTRVGPGEIFTPEFLADVDPARPLAEQRAEYAAANATSLVNRMLAYDWKYTLADTDLPKVTFAAAAAGVAPAFPLLDDRLVDFSLRLAPSLKVRGLALRWFFKHALRGFLPRAIITKRKHGFGLPFGPWLAQHARLRALAFDSVALLRDAGIVRSAFVDRLEREYLPQAPGYYGELVWILMMLGQWRSHARHAVPDGRAVPLGGAAA